MNSFTIFIFCVTIALVPARPQFGNEGFQQNQNFPNPSNPWLNPSSDFFNQFSNNFGNQNFNPNQSPPNSFGSFAPNPNNPFLPNQNMNSGTNQFIEPQQQQDQRQQQANQNQNQTSGNEGSTTAASVNPAIAQLKSSSQYVECNTGCVVLSEYNPVCGSDNVTYMNERKLDCANSCGRRLTANWEEITGRRGACTTGPRVP